MADITVGTVQPLQGALLRVETAGETLAVGDWVYQKSSDSKLWKADNDSSAETARVIGIIVYDGGAADDPVCLQYGGPVDLGTTLVQGPYVLSSTAAKMCPVADLGTGDIQSQTGYATTTAQFLVQPFNTGVAKT